MKKKKVQGCFSPAPGGIINALSNLLCAPYLRDERLLLSDFPDELLLLLLLFEGVPLLLLLLLLLRLETVPLLRPLLLLWVLAAGVLLLLLLL